MPPPFKAKKKGFSVLKFEQIATPSDRAIVLDDRPAVYAWYRDLSLQDVVEDEDAFERRVQELAESLQSPASSAFVEDSEDCGDDENGNGRIGWLYKVSVQEFGGGLSGHSRDLLAQIRSRPSARRELAQVLEESSVLMAPLYVGKAVALRKRIGQHVTGNGSDLEALLVSAGLGLSQCILRYCYVDATPEMVAAAKGLGNSKREPVDEVARFVEELLTRLSPAAFVRRPG